jgi:hypothetical protein
MPSRTLSLQAAGLVGKVNLRPSAGLDLVYVFVDTCQGKAFTSSNRERSVVAAVALIRQLSQNSKEDHRETQD